jgi:NAD(P)-dependent dehydrogenase (short-subunit alcohol dehydrogenase family)
MKKNAFVTGCDRGLGLALAELLLKKDYRVFAGSFLGGKWPELTELKEHYQDQLVILPLDVRSTESVQQASAAIAKVTDSLDLLINNAGLFTDRSEDILGELFFEDMKELYDTNSLGPLRVTQSVLPLLLKGNDKLLVNISSEAGSIEDCQRTKEYGYSMSKAALNMQTAILHNHLKEYGLKVFAIHPGYVRSYMLGHLNTEAEIEPKESAKGIYEQISKPYRNEGPAYLNYKGEKLPW